MSWEQSWNDFRMLPFNFPSMAGHLWFMYPLIPVYLAIPCIAVLTFICCAATSWIISKIPGSKWIIGA